ncbi:MAG: hypothetical protein H8Z69_01650 [Nanohaloarchaea archaeon]|nr:hypothetical protein [Candidatus Nanohaloarchaea archaeon]
MGWTAVDSPDEDEEAVLLNPEVEIPPVEVATAEDLEEGLQELEPGQANRESWDIVNEEFEAPEAERVQRVGLDLDNGTIDVYDGVEGKSTYIIGAIGTDGNLSIVDPYGRVSTSDRDLMAAGHHAAIAETLESEFGKEPNEKRETMDIGLERPTDIYSDMVEEGSYTVPEGDVTFVGFDRVEGNNVFNDATAAGSLLQELDEIAEFLVEYEEDFNPNNESQPGIPRTPMRDCGNHYKFRVSGTDDDVSIVINKNYRETEDGIEVRVEALSDHDTGRANLY